MMYGIRRWLNRRERGQALIAVLALLVVGGIIIVPFMYLSSTTLKYVKITENQIKAIYAADAGIEYAYWQIVTQESFPPTDPYTVDLPDKIKSHDSTVNSMIVNITITGSAFPFTVSAQVMDGATAVVNKSATIDQSGSDVTLTYIPSP